MRHESPTKFLVVDDAPAHEHVAERVVVVAQHMIGEDDDGLPAALARFIAVHLIAVGEKHAALFQHHILARGVYLLLSRDHIHHLHFAVEVDGTDVVAVCGHINILISLTVDLIMCKHRVLPPENHIFGKTIAIIENIITKNLMRVQRIRSTMSAKNKYEKGGAL